jgi:hypothetical protein
MMLIVLKETDEIHSLLMQQMWAEADEDLMRPPSLYPQRVAPHLIIMQQSPPTTSRGRLQEVCVVTLPTCPFCGSKIRVVTLPIV